MFNGTGGGGRGVVHIVIFFSLRHHYSEHSESTKNRLIKANTHQKQTKTYQNKQIKTKQKSKTMKDKTNQNQNQEYLINS